MFDKSIINNFLKIHIYFLGLFFLNNAFAADDKKKPHLKVIDDKILPTGIGIAGSFSQTTINKAVVPGIGLTYHALANPFAFKVDGDGKEAFPKMSTLGVDLYIYHDILKRNLWLAFYSYPKISYGISYRQINLFKSMSGFSVTFVSDIILQDSYDSNHSLYPKLGFGMGFFRGAIGSSGSPLSHPVLDEQFRIQPEENGAADIFYTSLIFLFRSGIGYKYKVSKNFYFVLEFLLEYNLLGTNFNKTFEIDYNNGAVPTQANYDGINTLDDKDKPPRPENASFYSYTVAANLEYTFNPAKRKFLKYELPDNRHTGELGLFVFQKQFSKMNYVDREVYTMSFENTRPHKNINFKDDFWGIGISALYSYRLVSKFCVLSSFEIVFYDGLVKRKLQSMDLADNNETRISLLAGIGGDYNILRLRLLAGYDIITSDYVSEHIIYGRFSKFFLKMGGGLNLFNHLGISAYAKVRPRQTYLQGLAIMYDSFEISLSYSF